MKVLFIVAPKNFRDEELFEPKKILEERGVITEIAALNTKLAIGVLGGKQKIDLDISEVDIDNYNAVIFVGGPGARIYFENPIALKIAKDAKEKDKLLGAICVAPTILANAGALSKKNVTCWPSESGRIEKGGAKYTKNDVIVDDNIVTASGPEAAKKFGEEILQLLKK